MKKDYFAPLAEVQMLKTNRLWSPPALTVTTT